MDDNITRNKMKHTLTDKMTSNENDQKPPSAIMNGRAVKCEGVHALILDVMLANDVLCNWMNLLIESRIPEYVTMCLVR